MAKTPKNVRNGPDNAQNDKQKADGRRESRAGNALLDPEVGSVGNDRKHDSAGDGGQKRAQHHPAKDDGTQR
jgi:hypothetical protein